MAGKLAAPPVNWPIHWPDLPVHSRDDLCDIGIQYISNRVAQSGKIGENPFTCDTQFKGKEAPPCMITYPRIRCWSSHASKSDRS